MTKQLSQTTHVSACESNSILGLGYPVFLDLCLPVWCPEGVKDVHKYMPQTLDGH